MSKKEKLTKEEKKKIKKEKKNKKGKSKNSSSEKISLVNKKGIKEFANVVKSDIGNAIHPEFSELSDKKTSAKKIKEMVKNNELYKVSTHESTIYATLLDKLNVDGTYHIGYWIASNPDKSSNVLGEFLDNVIVEKGIENIVLCVNQRDHVTDNIFLNKNRVMLFEGQVYYNGSSDPSVDEWVSLDGVSKSTFTSLNNGSNDTITYENVFEESKNSNEGTYQEEVVQNEEQILEPTQEEIYQESNTEGIKEEVSSEQEPELVNEHQEEVQEEQTHHEEPKSQTNWAEKFYSLEGYKNYGILSPSERFGERKVKNTYDRVESTSNTYRTDSLSTLRKNSDNVSFTKDSVDFSNYEQTRRRVLESLDRLKYSNNKNKDSIDNINKESSSTKASLDVNKTSTFDLERRIEEIKRNSKR